jgi:hypothetical protein
MDRPTHRATGNGQPPWLVLRRFTALVGSSFLFFLSGCAQLEHVMGRQAEPAAPAPQTQAAPQATAAPATEPSPVQTVEPALKPATEKKADESDQAGVAKEPPAQASSAAQAGGAPKPSEPDKALVDKEQAHKEKKARVSDKKKKPAKKPQAEPPSPTEDVFLPPPPLPSKPAAIGGSGG